MCRLLRRSAALIFILGLLPTYYTIQADGMSRAAAAPIEIVVATDGSGKYKTVQEAIMAVPAGSPDSPVIIRIKPGTYKDLIYVQREKRFFRLVGEVERVMKGGGARGGALRGGALPASDCPARLN